MTTTRNALFTLAALGLAAFAAHPASAQSTLTGTFYHAPSATIDSLMTAQQFIAQNPTPTGTFTATESLLQAGYGADVGGEDNVTVTTFLGADSSSYQGNKTATLSDGIFDFKGFVNVPATNPNYTFKLTSDDGSALFVDGTRLVVDDGMHANQDASATTQIGAGQHSVEVLYFNHNYNNGSGGAFLSANFGGLSTTASAAPEPSQIGMLALVALGLGALAVKARKRTTAAQTA